jgi:2-keto-4-pentenoate hydratase/2-oxohepta-3-ene-1,7-dioic acid hydratase in catechol pathway
MGAKILQICPGSLVVTGTVAEWEEWAGMGFPESGQYVVEGALVPVEIDHERDVGRYVEPNLWMKHPV